MTLIFEHPVWILLPAAIIAALVSYFLYRRDSKNAHFGKTLRVFLFLLRFTGLVFILLFLLKPLLKTSERELEAPIILVAQDNSQSLILGADSSFYQDQWPAELNGLMSDLEGDFEVRGFTFGERLSEFIDSLDYSGRVTDVSELLEGLFNRYSNRNVGAVVIASDGIYNTGKNPLYSGRKLNAPVYTIALGDTSKRRDLRISEVITNKLAYLGNRFPLEINLEALKAAGVTSQLTIEHKGKIVFSETLRFESENSLWSKRVLLDADQAGLQKYTIQIAPVEGEQSIRNNKRDVYIDVLENKQQILILAASPHPDLAALRNAISSNSNYEVSVEVASEFSGKASDYSLVIFHRIPSQTKEGQAVLTEVMQKGRPFLMVLGTDMDIAGFNSLKLGYSYVGYRESTSDIFASYAKGFPHFVVGEETQRMFTELPPLAVPFGDFQTAPGVVSLVNRRVGSIETQVPLISFNQVNGAKIGVIGGEGLWRWRMVNYLRSDQHDRFDRMISGMVQYLASRDDRRRFKVNAPRDLNENQRILFNAEVYNASYEAVNDPEVELKVVSATNDEYRYTFGRTGTGYRIDLGTLPAGEYTWEATTSQGGQSFKETGELNIQEIRLEMAALEANHAVLYRLASENAGEMFFPDQLNALTQAIRSNDDVVTLSYERTSLSDLINLKWLLFIILLLFSVEWLLRKWSGSY